MTDSDTATWTLRVLAQASAAWPVKSGSCFLSLCVALCVFDERGWSCPLSRRPLSENLSYISVIPLRIMGEESARVRRSGLFLIHHVPFPEPQRMAARLIPADIFTPAAEKARPCYSLIQPSFG